MWSLYIQSEYTSGEPCCTAVVSLLTHFLATLQTELDCVEHSVGWSCMGLSGWENLKCRYMT